MDKIPQLSKTTRRGLEVFRGRILKLPYTKERSRLVDLVTCLLEGTAENAKTKDFGQD